MAEPPKRVLVVDDDKDHAEAVADGLAVSGYECKVATGGRQALETLDRETFDAVVVDLVLHDLNGIDILRHAKARRPDTEAIVVTGYPSYDTALKALNEGAFDYIDKPVNIAILRAKLGKALERQSLMREMRELKQELGQRTSLQGIIGNGPAMQNVFRLIKSAAPTESTVLILGESGTGKELIARAIHAQSQRAGKRFVAINCAALPENLLESELFGHERGAFTGAETKRKGRFQFAEGGTLFLDEIGDMPQSLQAKILRAIEQREITPIGANEAVPVNVRILTATHRDLDALVQEGRFREDLYFRINVVRIEIPPLRNRLEDLPLLVSAFLKEAARIHKKKVKGITREALAVMHRYRWPGNVRELKNAIESMVVLAQDEMLDVKDLPRTITGRLPEDENTSAILPMGVLNLEQAERNLIHRALLVSQGNRKNAARLLGIAERTLYRKLQEYGIE